MLDYAPKLFFRKQAKREIKTIQHCSYFMGRTEWDKGLIDLFNPKAKYFHCEEALRDSFLQGKRHWSWRDDKKKTFISVISRPWYKGCDLILKNGQSASPLYRFGFRVASIWYSRDVFL